MTEKETKRPVKNNGKKNHTRDLQVFFAVCLTLAAAVLVLVLVQNGCVFTGNNCLWSCATGRIVMRYTGSTGGFTGDYISEVWHEDRCGLSGKADDNLSVRSGGGLEEVSVHCAESGLFRRRDFTGRSTVLLSAVSEVQKPADFGKVG